MAQQQLKKQADQGRFMTERSSSPKNVSEYLWMVLSLGITGVTVLLFGKVVEFQTHPYFEAARKGNFIDLLYGLPIAILFMVVDWIVHSVFDKRCDKYYIDQYKYPDPEMRRKRCETLVKWAYSMSYYIFSSYWAYTILKEADILPGFLGGQGIKEVMMKYKYLIPQATEEMKFFYIMQFGKHLGRFLNHCFIRRQGHFYQYALHHGLSSVLISFSYLTNQWLVGILVLFLHDLSEIILMIGRGYADYKKPNKIFLYSSYALLVVGWFILRIYNFLFDCIIPCYELYIIRHQVSTQIELEIVCPPGLFMIVMLVILLVMQVFWGALIYAYIFTRVYKDAKSKLKSQ